jgi:hypothetical protein
MFTKLSTLLAFSALVAPCLAAAHPLAKRDAFIGQTTWYGTGDSDPHVFCGQVPGFYPQLYE